MQAVVGSIFYSPRRRRRLARAGAALALAAGIVGAVIALPSPQYAERSLRPAPPAADPPPIQLTRADRAAIGALLDEFVPAGVQRRAPGVAYDLAAPRLRGDATRQDWLAGDLPLYPYEPDTTHFRQWRVEYANAEEVGLELILFPGPHERLGPIMFKVGVHETPAGWRVTSFYPAATYARSDQPAHMRAHADWAPPAAR